LHDNSKAKLARKFDTHVHVALLNKLAEVVPLLLRNGNSKSAKTTPKLDNATLRSILQSEFPGCGGSDELYTPGDETDSVSANMICATVRYEGYQMRIVSIIMKFTNHEL
jgi:hypothetical protein